MDRYFKTEKTSATGLKVQEIEKRIAKFNEDINVLGEKYGFRYHYHSGMDIKGLIAVKFNNNPDTNLWKRVSQTNGFYPKRCNKEAYSDFRNIESIRRYEIDRIIGLNDTFNNCGYDFSPKDVYLFVVESDWEISLPEDLTEISNLEYIKYVEKQ